MELDRRLLVAHCATHTPCQSCSGRRIEPNIIYLQGRHDKLASWCNTVTDDNTRTYSCAESQSVPMYLDVETSSFYTELPLAEVVRHTFLLKYFTPLLNMSESECSCDSVSLSLSHSVLSLLSLYFSLPPPSLPLSIQFNSRGFIGMGNTCLHCQIN
uniref:Uncharacterized protein n=1 Tax=Oncorhynchus kisutch TaxID=8019 RepID=A0A8C7G698_ONCKI